MLFRFENPSCYQLNGPKVCEIDKDSKNLIAFQQRSFHYFFPPKTNLNTFVAVSRDHGDNICDKFLCHYLKVTKDCKGVIFDQHSLEINKYHIFLHKSPPPHKHPLGQNVK